MRSTPCRCTYVYRRWDSWVDCCDIATQYSFDVWEKADNDWIKTHIGIHNQVQTYYVYRVCYDILLQVQSNP